jgi:hypothetical protein
MSRKPEAKKRDFCHATPYKCFYEASNIPKLLCTSDCHLKVLSFTKQMNSDIDSI